MAGKNSLRDRSKALWLRGMKMIGNTAANIASNTRYKVDEVTLQNRRRELLGDIAGTAYALWMKGEAFPEKLSSMLDELQQLDNQLVDLKAEKYAFANRSKDIPSGGESDAGEEPDETAAEQNGENVLPDAGMTAGKPGIPADVPPAQEAVSADSPVQNEINGYFDDAPSVGKMAEKVNSSLDQLSERIKSFPAEGSSADDESAD